VTGAPLRGCGTALATPFTRDGAIDEPALRSFIEWQLDEGIDFVVPCGSTGEAATMSLDEHRRVVELTVEQVRGRVPVVAGAGSNDTQKAIALSRELEAVGATHLLHVAPMYSKPPQRGVVTHFRAIADAVAIPIVMYNVPSRTGCNMDADTTLVLASHERITGMKEASGLLPQITDILAGRPEGFSLLSGDDELTLPILALGGDGLISVVSNVVPAQMAALVRAGLTGDLSTAREMQMRLLPWLRTAFVETNPMPVKAALAMLGRFEDVLRSPLMPLAAQHHDAVRAALRSVGAL
jgi:4-hydroxy-tetrahydrodipicolinate synthase